MNTLSIEGTQGEPGRGEVHPRRRLTGLEHTQVVEALADGNAERCQVLQAAHVTASHSRLLALERRQEGAS